MPEYFDQQRDAGFAERYLGGWRVIAAAWALAIMVVMLFSGVQALASHHGTSPEKTQLAGAVIPRHDPSCAGSATAPNCHSFNDDLARAEAEAEIGGSYGW